MYILNSKERACILTIARRTRIDYLAKNSYTYFEDDIDMLDENKFVSDENVEETVLIENDRNLCANEIGKVFKDPVLGKSVEALTLKERDVLFLRFWKNKTDKEIGQELQIKEDTIRKTRERLMKKIENKYKKLKGNDRNDF